MVIGSTCVVLVCWNFVIKKRYMHNWQGRGNCAPLYNVSFMLFPYISSLIFHPFIFHLTSQQYVNTVRKGCGKRKRMIQKKIKRWYSTSSPNTDLFGQSSPYNYKSEKIRAHYLNGRKYSTCRINFSLVPWPCAEIFSVTSGPVFPRAPQGTPMI